MKDPSEVIGSLDAGALEDVARAIVADGLATRELAQALDQLVADRTNGEPLDAALGDLRTVLVQGRHRRADQATDWPAPEPGTETP